MKQSEKLDIVLRELYNRRDDMHYHDAREILVEKGIDVSDMEIMRIGDRLTSDGLVENIHAVGHAILYIKSRGVEYCEENSYSSIGRSLLTMDYSINITNASGVNVISHSPNASIDVGASDELIASLIQLRSAIEVDQGITEDQRKELLESMAEAEESHSKGTKAKGAMRHILEATKNIATIAPLAKQVWDLCFGS